MIASAVFGLINGALVFLVFEGLGPIAAIGQFILGVALSVALVKELNLP